MTEKNIAYAGGFLILALILYVFLRGFKGVAKDAVGAVADTAVGTVEAVGEVVGIPITSSNACEEACKAGNSWRASLDCTASRFLTYLREGK